MTLAGRGGKSTTDVLLNGALLVGCVYEVVALLTPLPTITKLLKTWGHQHPLGKATLWLWCGFVAWHFMEPDEVD